MKYKNLMAKALYDNLPESPEELAFRKGDILTVIEQNTGGLEGWWLCSLHGRQGIAPGNRLKLLIGPMFEGQSPASPSPPQGHALQQRPLTPQGVYQVPPSHQSLQGQGIYQIPPSKDVYQVPQRSALTADGTPSKVVTPIRVGQTYAYSPASDSSRDLYDVPPIRPQGVYDIPASKQTGQHSIPRAQGLYDTPPSQGLRSKGLYDKPPASQGVYSTPPCQNNIAQDEGNYDFPQPSKHKQEGIYDVPPQSLSKASPCSNYDFPPSSEPMSRKGMNGSAGIYDIPASQLATGGSQDLYDIPRGMPQNCHTSTERDRKKSVYDIPPGDTRLLGDVTEGVNRLSFSSTGSTRSSMSTSSSSAGSPAECRLALDLDSAVQRLSRLQQGLESSVCTLQTLAASPHWRTYSFMERHANEVRVSLERVKCALADFLIFGCGAAANATTVSDPGMHSKLRRQLQRLEDSHQILQRTHQTLENNSWALNILATGAKHQNKSDELERFVMVSRTVPDDAKQLASTIGGSAELLFRRARIEGIVHPFTCTPTEDDGYGAQTKPLPVSHDKANMNSEKCVKSWMEDYDYVHLQGKDEFERQQKELLEKENITKQSKVQLGQEQLNQFKQLEQEVIKPVENDITKWISHQHSTGSSSDSSSNFSMGGGAPLCLRDRQLLTFYADQCEQHFVTLLNAVDAFFGCVKAGQPPRIFVAHGKFVILSAHKLVFIGDTLSRQASAAEVANHVMNLSNMLCEMLKTVVGATKIAALHYPNTAAVQEMVDRVTDLSHLAQQFKVQLSQMAEL
ncbi:enhancer of filamentation 1-like [Sinocyclocheilus anshuiensis]|uniref:Breast cancer anti-estrogen resistance protein 1 n=1 Tax=Sinocyclocheilus anshuiensis TaxID=1608454 RepID=A0A671KF79_9TELE|nr:PREDICTED: enhancer of filamentation 1-like [Sinocyclocheilus anshuiensis]